MQSTPIGYLTTRYETQNRRLLQLYTGILQSYVKLPRFLVALKDAISNTMYKLNVDSHGVL